VRFIYDVLVVEIFISLMSAGFIIFDYVNVSGNSTTSSTVSPNSFIIVSGGGSVYFIVVCF
jgi:hypothetical protein